MRAIHLPRTESPYSPSTNLCAAALSTILDTPVGRRSTVPSGPWIAGWRTVRDPLYPFLDTRAASSDTPSRA